MGEHVACITKQGKAVCNNPANYFNNKYDPRDSARQDKLFLLVKSIGMFVRIPF